MSIAKPILARNNCVNVSHIDSAKVISVNKTVHVTKIHLRGYTSAKAPKPSYAKPLMKVKIEPTTTLTWKSDRFKSF